MLTTNGLPNYQLFAETPKPTTPKRGWVTIKFWPNYTTDGHRHQQYYRGFILPGHAHLLGVGRPDRY